MALGENPPKLFSENDPTQQSRTHLLQGPGQGGVLLNSNQFNERNQTYLTDDSVPSTIYSLIDKYRDKARNSRPGDKLALLIDDFFGEAHAILKDTHLREIARIKNENAVEVTRLKHDIQRISGGSSVSSLRAADHHTAFKVQASFADNEVERQRRLLIEENERLKRKLRAAETLLASGTQERKHFMQGASWVAKKSQMEADKHTSKLAQLCQDLEKRTQHSLKDPQLNEYDGKQVWQNKEWVKAELAREVTELNLRYRNIFENVNYELSKAFQRDSP